jgi:hypothetical protein
VRGLKKDAFSNSAFLGHNKIEDFVCRKFPIFTHRKLDHSSHALKGRAFWFSRAIRNKQIEGIKDLKLSFQNIQKQIFGGISK